MSDKWTLNTVWYLIIPIFEKLGMELPTRSYVKTLIKELCEAVSVTRESLRIFAGIRAELYFDGEWTSVSFDSIKELSEKGTDIIFIEKEGIPEVLTDYADKYGLSLVNTRGHLTEYGKDLMRTAKHSGAHVVIMADYDASGVKIASESPTEMPWIGANDKMLQYFKISRESVSIESESEYAKDYVKDLVENGKHGRGKSYGRIDTRFKDVDVDFLCDKDNGRRVELDAILANVGGERYFEYVLDTLKELYPSRDYNRAIGVPETAGSEEHNNFKKMLDEKIRDTISAERAKIISEQSNVSGFINVQDKKNENTARLKKVLTDIPEYNDFVTKLNELKSHPFFSNGKAIGPTKISQ